MSTDTKKLIPHKSCYYDDKCIRQVYAGGGVWNPETDDEFLDRFVHGDSVTVMDLEKCCELHPLIQEFKAQGKDYEAVIVGVMEGVGFRQVFKDHGFHNWSAFRAMTEFVCPGLKKIFEEAQRIREEIRLERAEQALEKRAIDGVKEEVYTPSGKLAGYRTRYSDKLLEVHLKALNPEKYSEKHQHEVKGMVLSVNMGLRDIPEAPNADVEES